MSADEQKTDQTASSKVAESAASNETRKSATPPAEEKPEPLKILWSGEKPPPAKVVVGMTEITLPTEAEQRAGFEHEHAALLLRNLAGRDAGYRRLQSKGGPNA